jgi:putative transposase
VLGIARSTIYYKKKRPELDWIIKCEIEEILRKHHSYGSPRIALALGKNHKQVERVMKRFGIKAYRRRGKKYRKTKKIAVIYPNLLLFTFPQWRHHIWAADFTEVWWKGKKIYVATIMDLFTREIIGIAISKNKGLALTMVALQDALLHHPRPGIFHSDNGSEYRAIAYVETLEQIGTVISRTHPGCPWENGYQESFYNQFKVDLGDPNRFATFGELIAEIYRAINYYNTERIHTALKMSPREFARRVGDVTINSIV